MNATAPTVYEVRVTREDGWWMIRVPALDGLTQARRLGEVEAVARSYIALMLDVARDSFDLNLAPRSREGDHR